MKDDLNNIRKRVDDADRRLIDALAERQEIINQVAALKAGSGSEIRDRDREDQILTRLSAHARDAGLDDYFVESLFQQILDHSVRYQTDHLVEQQNPEHARERVIVAYQGTDGAYSHLAAQRHFSSRNGSLRCHGYNTFEQAANAVQSGEADYALLPIENTTAGSINDTYDLLARMELNIVGEEVLRVDHCLVTLEPVPLNLIRRVLSHPQAIAQCSDFLSTLQTCQVTSYHDTAMAVKKIREDEDIAQAAIASREAARRYGLHVLKRGIANQNRNYTRFVVVAREEVRFDLRIPCKTSIVFATPHQKGALLQCLNVLGQHGLNMVKLESRPRLNTPWEYLFYLDLEGNVVEDAVREALDELEEQASYLKVLGSYPRREVAETKPTVSTTARSAPSPNGDTLRGGVRKRRAPVTDVSSKKPYQLAARKGDENTLVRVGSITIGGEQPVLIAGPCSVESRDQILACARAVRDGGGHILRGGCFKPRTSPYSFQGMGYEGLDHMEEAGQRYGLPIVTEVLQPGDVTPIARQADMLQVGARNMQNFALLKEVGRADRPVLLKRGMMASIDELLAAAEYILSHGNDQVVLCERGIRTFETATRNTLDLSAVPVLRERTHLPVIVDPAHACGDWRWILPLTKAALAAGAHGVMVEVHPEPAKALSDGPQSLKFDTFEELARTFHREA